MSISSQLIKMNSWENGSDFSLIPYVKNGGGFLKWGGHFKKALERQGKRSVAAKKTDIEKFTKEDATTVLENFRIQMKRNLIGEEARLKAIELQTSLNKMVTDYEANYEKLIRKLFDELTNKKYEELLESGILYQRGGTLNMDFSKFKTEIDSEITEIRNMFDKVSKEGMQNEDLYKYARKINDSLNSVRGDLFEYFLAVVFQTAGTQMKELKDISIDDILNDFENNFKIISNYNNRDTFINVAMQAIKKSSKTKAAVTGSNKGVLRDKNNKATSSIDISVGKNKISLNSSSQGKTDVFFKDNALGDLLGISAKNYSSSKRISLVSNAMLKTLIYNWPCRAHIKNLAMNGLSSKHQYINQYSLMKDIFFLQGLLGVDKNSYPDFLMIQNNNGPVGHKISVFSTYDLITNYSSQITAGKGFRKDSQGIHPPDYPRREYKEKAFTNFVNTTKIGFNTSLTIAEMIKMVGY